MASWFSALNPVPSFSEYTGPYTVGTLDVEIPVAELSSPAPAPDPSISTINFRIFYPCKSPSPGTAVKPVYWLPEPQRRYLRTYLRFLGVSAGLSGFLQYSLLFNILSHVTIPAVQDAKILSASTSKRWPVMIFSHGLAGSRNGYSQVLGALASHGMVVVAPDHRDGSAPISFIRSCQGFETRVVEYKSIPHIQGPVVEDGRNAQLRIRLWELGLVHEALLRVDRRDPLTNIAAQHKPGPDSGDLAMFANSLDVHASGRISWSGHSFGAATMIQFLKSVFYMSSSTPTSYKPLFQPLQSSSIVSQITSKTPLILFDLWALPLRSAATDWLWRQPLPCYSLPRQGRYNLLAILSEAFVKWKPNLRVTKSVLFPKRTTMQIARLDTESENPHVFYAIASSHSGQSDFGVICPWLTKKVFKSNDPVRTLRLNVRAVLELMRQNDFEIADTSSHDMETADSESESTSLSNDRSQPSYCQDPDILATDGRVPGWVALTPDDAFSEAVDEASNTKTGRNAPPVAVLDGDILKDDTREGKL